MGFLCTCAVESDLKEFTSPKIKDCLLQYVRLAMYVALAHCFPCLPPKGYIYSPPLCHVAVLLTCTVDQY